MKTRRSLQDKAMIALKARYGLRSARDTLSCEGRQRGGINR